MKYINEFIFSSLMPEIFQFKIISCLFSIDTTQSLQQPIH